LQEPDGPGAGQRAAAPPPALAAALAQQPLADAAFKALRCSGRDATEHTEQPLADAAREALRCGGRDAMERAFWGSVWPRLRAAGWTADLRAGGAGFAAPGCADRPLPCFWVRSAESPRRGWWWCYLHHLLAARALLARHDQETSRQTGLACCKQMSGTV